MKFEIVIDDNGQITVTKEDEIVIISRYMSKVCDVIEDIYKNNGVSTLIPFPTKVRND